VIGHVGADAALGERGWRLKVQGQRPAAAKQLIPDAAGRVAAGAVFPVVAEGIPTRARRANSQDLRIPRSVSVRAP